MKKAIERAGPKNVKAVVLDGGGDWSATENEDDTIVLPVDKVFTLCVPP